MFVLEQKIVLRLFSLDTPMSIGAFRAIWMCMIAVIAFLLVHSQQIRLLCSPILCQISLHSDMLPQNCHYNHVRCHASIQLSPGLSLRSDLNLI
jgi:hypothetical protein